MNFDMKIVVCGIGGQGILFLARVLYALARLTGLKVMGSETHGMSQRGGSVTSHVKIGDYASPMVRLGTADLLIVLKDEEIYGSLPFLRKGGTILINAAEDFALIPQVAKALKKQGIRVVRRNALAGALQLGNPQATNLILVSAGICAKLFPTTSDQLRQVVETITPPAFRERNLAAIEAGKEI